MLRRIPGFVGLVVLFVCVFVCSGFVVFFGGDRFIYDSFAYFGVSFNLFFANYFSLYHQSCYGLSDANCLCFISFLSSMLVLLRHH